MKLCTKRLLGFILSICMTISLLSVPVFADDTGEASLLTAAEVMTKETYIASDGTELPYRLYVPEDYDASKNYSFLLFLHGAGNRGNDNESQVKVNTGLIDRIINGEEITYGDTKIDSSKEFIIVAPQCASDYQWVDTSWAVTPDPSYNLSEVPQSQYMTAVVELLDKMKNDYSLNSDRLYVSGLSMGGFGTWDLIMRYPDLFAAAIPMGGAGDTKMASEIAKTPVWTFHQLQDPVVAPNGTLAMVRALCEVGASVKFTPYFDGVHNAWTKGFAEPDMLNWLYSHTKNKVKIAFVGDSITYGAGLTDRTNEAFPYLVKKELFNNYNVANFGVSATSALSTAKAPYINTPEYKESLEFAPDILHIMLGTNDIKNENWDLGKDNFIDDYMKIIDSYRAVNPEVDVYIGVPPRIFKENVYGTRSTKILEEEGIPAIKELAKKANATLVDYFEPLKDSGEYFPDFLHPDSNGHKIMADIVMDTIVLKEKEFVPSKSILDGASDWARDEVSYSYAAGIMPRILSENYQADITRQEFCQMVVNMLPAGITPIRDGSFKDCDDASVSYAYSIGVVNGIGSDQFAPEANATRQEMATMIYRAYKLIAPDAKSEKFGTAPDRSLVDAWAIEAVDFLNTQEIMKGDENGNINPYDNTSREEAVLLVYRAYCSANRYGK